MKKGRFFAMFIFIGLGACDTPESPQFKYLENVLVNLESLTTANLHAEAVLFNPNKNNITIKGAKIDIMMADQKIAELDQDFNIKAMGNEDFKVPLDVKIRLKDLNLNAINSALGLLGGTEQEIRYLGKIRVKAYGVPFSVKVDYKDNLRIKI